MRTLAKANSERLIICILLLLMLAFVDISISSLESFDIFYANSDPFTEIYFNRRKPSTVVK